MRALLESAPTLNQRKPIEPGVYKGVPFDEYWDWAAVNASTLNRFAKTPAHVRYWLDHGGDDDETASTRLGWLLHLAVLEPERFALEVVVAPNVNKRTNAGKAILQEFETRHAGKYVVDEELHHQVLAMQRAVLSHPKAGPYFSGAGENELSIVWDDAGVRCKARIDRVAMLEDWPVVGDLKSDKDASPWAWERTVVRYGYHISAAHYLAGLEAHFPTPAGRPFRRFVHFVVESPPPHCVALYELDDSALEDAAAKRRRYLREWKECQETGCWPGYPADVQPVTLPRWALTDSGSEE